jgi:hypothetical protein
MFEALVACDVDWLVLHQKHYQAFQDGRSRRGSSELGKPPPQFADLWTLPACPDHAIFMPFSCPFHARLQIRAPGLPSSMGTLPTRRVRTMLEKLEEVSLAIKEHCSR